MNSAMPENSTILVELPSDFRAFHPHDGALEVDILPAGEIGMEASSDFDQGADASPQFTASVRRAQDFCQELQHRRLAAPFGPIIPSASPRRGSRDHILESPEFTAPQLVPGTHGSFDERRDQISECSMPFGSAESLPHVLERDSRRHVRHSPRRYIRRDGR